MIADVFSRRPTDLITPKEISRELGLDLQLVTSLMKRLMDEGVIDRISRGKYRLKIDMVCDKKEINEIVTDMEKIALITLGIPPHSNNKESDEDDPYRRLKDAYVRIRSLGGEVMALNLLRVSSRKKLEKEECDLLFQLIKGVDN